MNPPNNKGKRVIKINSLTQAKLIRLMLDGDLNCEELAEETGLHYVTVLQYARELHRAGAAFIHHWEKDTRGRDVIKVYKIGQGKDAKRQRMTAGERQARVRKRKQMMTAINMTAGPMS
jgi:predicted ArsR family transcriptional regulator